MINSVMTTVSVYDEVEATEGSAVEVNCAEVPYNNIAYRAAKLVEENTGIKLRVNIKKGIPIGGGMGGSSADGAAVLFIAKKICESKGVRLDIKPLATSLGSDVYFMTRGGACLVGGTGDMITPVECRTDFTALVVNCGEVSTAACYKAFDEIGGKGRRIDITGVLERGEKLTDDLLFNDLTLAAKSLNPRVAEAEKILLSHNIKSHLTGSGGCIFALTESEAIRSTLAERGFPSFFVRYMPCEIEII